VVVTKTVVGTGVKPPLGMRIVIIGIVKMPFPGKNVVVERAAVDSEKTAVGLGSAMNVMMIVVKT